MIDANIPRWTFASVSKHFLDRLTDAKFYVEGAHRDSSLKESLYELRMDGPFFTTESLGLTSCYIEVSILVSALKTDKDFHLIHKLVGAAASAMSVDIACYKYGNGVQDDGTSLLGCYQLKQRLSNRERVQINHFGQIETSTPLLQATVEAHYEMLLKT